MSARVHRDRAVLVVLATMVAYGLFAYLYSLPVAAQEETEESEAATATASSDTVDQIDQAAATLRKNQVDITAKEQEIAELNKKIAELQNKEATAEEEAELINSQLQAIRQRLAKAQLELKQTQLSIAQVKTQRQTTEVEIEELAADIKERRERLRELIRLLYEKEQIPLITIWLTTGSLSDLLAERAAVQQLQDQSIALMKELQQRTDELKQRQEQLAAQQQELGQLHNVLSVQQQSLASQKDEQAVFLQAKKEEQLRYQQRIAEAEAARKEIEQGLFALKNAGVELSLTTATDMARLASQLTGVRPALLLAVLKVESNVGKNIGNGVFPDDMQPASREPFLRIAAKLGRKPQDMPISAAPSYGWGGAMGPAQIMPQTWEGIEPRLSALLKKPVPDPYELTDAFVANAILLADKGATSPAGEREAVGRYLAGPNWQRFPWYIDRVFAVVAEYEKEGL